MKHEWRKLEKDLYINNKNAKFITLEKMKYLTITGIGNPNDQEFSEKIGLLYQMSYAIKMTNKKNLTNERYDYTVYPLEGNWSLTDYGKQLDYLDKNELVYKIMIRQPDFINENDYLKALALVKTKNDDIRVDDVKFEEIEEGLCVQMLHVGSYDNEKETFDKMKDFIKENNYQLKTLEHKEIYLSDFRKVSQDKLKTVLRYYIK